MPGRAETLLTVQMGAQLPGARLVLAGVANALDLIERALPLLAALGARPRLLPFPAYDAGQLQALLSQRLAALPGPVFQAQALRLCAKKARRWLPCLALQAAPSHRHERYPVHMPGDGAQQQHALRAAASPMSQTLNLPDSPRWRRAAGTCAAHWRQPQNIDLRSQCMCQVAARSGDMRRALEACAGALDQLLLAAGAPTPHRPGARPLMAPAPRLRCATR